MVSMKFCKASLLAILGTLLLNSVPCNSQPTDSSLVKNAQSIDDLRYVLGPNYKLFVAAYWRFMVWSCGALGAKLWDDYIRGRLEKYCAFLTRCPEQYENTQSCLASISAYSVSLACCSTTRTTPEFIPNAQVTCNSRRVLSGVRIFGGFKARQGAYPWVIMTVKNDNFACGGILVDSNHVITAAHCFDSHNSLDRYQIVAGKHTASLAETDPNEQRVNVTSFIIHEQYNKSTSWNDIALMELSDHLEFTDFVLPACLPSPTDRLEPLCTVAGFGKTDGYNFAEVLMEVELNTYNHTECLKEFNNTAVNLETYLHEGTICAANGKVGRKDACKGDSGSPLMCVHRTQNESAWFVEGMVSHGNYCAQPGEPGIYVNIQHYVPWIMNAIDSFSKSSL